MANPKEQIEKRTVKNIALLSLFKGKPIDLRGIEEASFSSTCIAYSVTHPSLGPIVSRLVEALTFY